MGLPAQQELSASVCVCLYVCVFVLGVSCSGSAGHQTLVSKQHTTATGVVSPSVLPGCLGPGLELQTQDYYCYRGNSWRHSGAEEVTGHQTGGCGFDSQFHQRSCAESALALALASALNDGC